MRERRIFRRDGLSHTVFACAKRRVTEAAGNYFEMKNEVSHDAT